MVRLIILWEKLNTEVIRKDMLEGRSNDNLNFWVWGGNDNINKKCEGKKRSSLKDTNFFLPS